MILLFFSPAFGQDAKVRVLQTPTTHADEALDDVQTILIEIKP